MFVSLTEATKSKFKASKDSQLYMASNKNGSGHAVTYTLSADTAKAARIMPKDRVDILFDRENRMGCIRRVQVNGVCASAYGVAEADIKPGEFYKIRAKVRHVEGTPWVDNLADCSDVEITPEGVFFKLPESATF